ncbi:acyl-CoA thioesterase [Sphingobacterium daejeonense]|jgi:acyl-CoA thioester hydrolase|uniref:Acyl-CoA thioesterase n=1 Tax=Sphingobacterium daejeonense TaxID=371142 RepID=A0ABW3RGV3_9SPHI|nr:MULTISPECIES: acyl-CoA thioesterase [Sphingobacterium]MCT1530295.1 acyl-CoA thioesterase [Sphingobacterium daejeonense]VTP92802.1 acyl-CoA thioesterase YbgC [Sphingobacterium daejeonense]
MEENIFYEGQVLWSQIDANVHLRHSAYADFCAQARSNMLNQLGLSLQEFNKNKIGPILFREELNYLREIGLDEKIKVSVEITKYNTQNSRFSFRHVIYKENGVKAAIVVVDGAWMNIIERKLTSIPDDWKEIIYKIPKSEDYTEIDS